MTKAVDLGALSEEQRLAATYDSVPVAIIAGAGTGKTTVMSARVEHLIASGEVSSNEILGLTFTNKAASQLRSRIAKQLGKEFQDQLPTIATYHSFARQLLTDHGALLGIESDHRTLTDSARAQFALKVLQNTKQEIKSLDYATGRLVEMILNLDDLLAEHLLEGEVLANFDRDWIIELQPIATNDDMRTAVKVAAQRIELVGLVTEFRNAKHEAGLIDFADQMRLSVNLLQSDKQLIESLRQQYRCVLLDEYQDTSVAQQQMLLLAFGDGHSVTAVGDPLQSIYAWRGASAETTRSFPYLFKSKSGEPAQTLSLSKNYRSAGNILMSANSTIVPIRTANPGSIPLEQGDLKLGAGQVQVGCYESTTAEVAAIVAQISELISAGVAPDDIAVLGRTTATMLNIHEALVATGIPAALVGVETITRTPEVVEILALVEAAANPMASTAVARLLISPRLNIGDRDLAALADRAKQIASEVLPDPELPAGFSSLDSLVQSSLADALTDLGEAKLSPAARARMQQLAGEIEQVRNVGNALDAVWRAIMVLNLDIELYANPVSRLTQRNNVVAGFVELVRNWSESSDDQSLSAFLAWISAAKRFKLAPKIEVPLVDGAVSLLTIHRAKGLEWPHVFIPEVTETVFPSNRGRSVFTSVADAIPHSLRGDRNSLPPDPIADRKSIADFKAEVKNYSAEEELRLFYVALTRAQQSVTVTTSWWGDTQKLLRGPSDFYNEVAKTATKVLADFPRPADEQTNPNLVEQDVYRTQANPEYRARLAQVAQQVAASVKPVTPNTLTAAEQDQVSNWDRAIAWLTTVGDTKTVALPNLVTATNLVKAIDSPDQFAAEFLRPMPAAPTLGASFGTKVHQKIERYYQQATLIDIDDLRAEPKPLQISAAAAFNAFESSKYAQLPAAAIERSFQLPIGGMLISGRIDAVFIVDGKPLLIDWKTGNPKNANELQLAIYRLAWSKMEDVKLTDISARFVFLPDLVEIESTELLTEAEIISKLQKTIL